MYENDSNQTKKIDQLAQHPFKKESRQIKRAKSPEPVIAAHLG